MNAKEFITSLKIIGQEYSGVIPKREIFSLAKEFQHMPVQEVINLLQDTHHDYRMVAISMLDWKDRDTKTTFKEKKEI